MESSSPDIQVIGDGEVSDAAISALARLLLASVDDDQDDQTINTLPVSGIGQG